MFLTTGLCAAAFLAAAAVSAHAAETMAGSASPLPSTFSANASLATGMGRSFYDLAQPWSIDPVVGEAHVGALIGSFGIQADLWGGADKYVYFDGDSPSARYFGAGLHLNARSADGLIGGLVSVGVTPDGYNATMLNTAIEAQRNLGNFTLGAQAGYTQTLETRAKSNFTMSEPEGWYVHGIARWFAGANLMVAGDAGYSGLSDANDDHADAWRWGARIEYKPDAIPVSGFLAYQGYDWRQSGSTSVAHVFLVGVSLIGGDNSLAARYRGAAALDDRNILYGVNYAP